MVQQKHLKFEVILNNDMIYIYYINLYYIKLDIVIEKIFE